MKNKYRYGFIKHFELNGDYVIIKVRILEEYEKSYLVKRVEILNQDNKNKQIYTLNSIERNKLIDKEDIFDIHIKELNLFQRFWLYLNE